MLRPLVCLLLTAAAVAGQSDPLNEDWRWEHYSSSSGLPSNHVLDIVQTSDGLVWVSTSGGLCWFDGFRWQDVQIELGDPTALSFLSDLAGSLLVVHDRRLFRVNRSGIVEIPVRNKGATMQIDSLVPIGKEDWILRTGDRLWRCTRGVIEPFATPDGRKMQRLDVLGIARDGVAYATTTQGVFVWCEKDDPKRWVQICEGPGMVRMHDSGGFLRAHEPGESGQFTWTGAAGSSLQRVPFGGHNLSSASAVAPNGDAVLVNDDTTVSVCRGGKWTLLKNIPPQLENPDKLYFQQNGDLWSAGDMGLFRFRASRRRWARWQHDKPSLNRTNALLRARDGTIWIGATGGCVVRHPDGRFEPITEVLGKTLGSVTGLAQDDSGAIWVSSGAHFAGAYRFHDGRWQHFGPAQGLHAPRVHGIRRGRGGRMWFLGISPDSNPEPGAFVYDGKTFERWGVDEGLPSGRIYCCAELGNGDVWFGTRAGLSRWRAGRWKHWGWDTGLRTIRVFTLAAGPDGRIWFGHQTNGNGLGWIDANDRAHYYDVKDGLVNNYVSDIECDTDGTLWIGTRGGLASLRDGTFSTFHRTHGLSQPRMWPILPTPTEILVGTTGGGVFALSREEEDDPHPVIDVMSNPMGGEGVAVRWHPLAYSGALPSEAIETRYRLDEGAWSPWNTTRSVELLNASPGTHRFTVQAKGLFGGYDAAGKTIEFEIPLPFHLHPIFIGLVIFWALASALVGTVFWRHRRRDRLRIKASEERHLSLVDDIPICIHEIDLQGRLRSMNPAGLRMVGAKSEDEIRGVAYLDFVAPSDRRRVGDLLFRAMQGEAAAFEFSVHDPDGKHRVLASRLLPVSDENGSVQKILGYAQDTTDRVQAEEHRRELEQQLRQAQKMEAIGHLAGGVAHDFNNLLTVIGGNASLIETEVADRDLVLECAAAIQNANDRAAAFTRQLLALGSRQMVSPRTVDLNQLIQHMEDMLRRLIGGQIGLTTSLSSKPTFVLADPGQMEQIILNLVVNARDAMPDGGSLSIKTSSGVATQALLVDGKVLEADGFVQLEVGDDGIGMDADTQSRIFDPFFTTKSREHGTGLGLATTYGIVKQINGHIVVDSKPAQGTRFSVFLPWVDEAPLATAEDEPPPLTEQGDETVLVVEDDPDVLDLVGRMLRDLGYTELLANDPTEALRIARENEGPIHLLLTDLIMPGMNGCELAQKFLKHRPDARLVFMSGHADERILAEAQRTPNAALLNKPFDRREFAAMLHNELRPLRT